MTAPRRLYGLVRTEVALHRRHGVLAATAATAVLWTLVLAALPTASRPAVLPWLLFLEVSALGFLFAPALAIIERANGVTAAMRLSRLSPATALAVRTTTLTLSAVGVALVLTAAAGAERAAMVAAAVGLTTALLTLLAVTMVGRSDTLTAYLARTPGVAAALLAPALLDGAGLLDSPLLSLSPATGALRLISGNGSPAEVVWLVVWVVGLSAAAIRIGFDVRPTPPPRPGRRYRRRGITVLRRSGRWTAIRSLARVDRRIVLGDRLLLLMAAGLPLIALAARWFAGPGVDLVDRRFGIDVRPDLPAVVAFVLVLHVPVMVGALAGLLFLEDRDAGLLPVVATTPASLATLAAYRLTATALVAAVAVAGGLAIAGASHPAGAVAAVATAIAGGAVATLPAVLMAAFARDRVQGVGLMKAMSVPLYAPVAWWFVDDRVAWLFALLPTAWAARTWWATSAGEAIASAAGCLVLSGAVLAVAVPRVLRRPIEI